MRSLTTFVLALALVAGPATVQSASICQKGKKVKLRPDVCKGKEVAVTLTDNSGDLSGVWKRRDGNALTDTEQFTATFITLNADGSGKLNRRQESTHVLRCLSLRYARGAGTPTATLDINNGNGGSNIEIVQVSRAGDVLTVSDGAGTSAFDRVAGLDADAECPALVETGRLTGIPAPDDTSWSGLPFDGMNFVYRSGGTAIAINGANGAVATPPTLNGSGQYPQAFEGGDIWGNCACGSVNQAVRSAAGTGTQADVIDTNVFGASTIQGLAVPQPGRLFVFARAQSPLTNRRLLLINTAAEPDTLVSSVSSDMEINQLAFDGARLWGFQSNSQAVARIDPSSALATGTFLIPDTDVHWLALAAAPGKLFFLGVTRDGTSGVLATFAIPAS